MLGLIIEIAQLGGHDVSRYYGTFAQYHSKNTWVGPYRRHLSLRSHLEYQRIIG